jgi:hypothetical protein
MQDLIPGEDYEITHPSLMWKGKASFVKYHTGSTAPYRFKDLRINVGGKAVVEYFEANTKKDDNSFTLGDAPWKFELIPRIEENE